MIYIAICDDNEKTVEILKKKVMEFLKKSNEFADITVYTQSENLQYDIHRWSGRTYTNPGSGGKKLHLQNC